MKKIVGLIALIGFGFTAIASPVKTMGNSISKITMADSEAGIQFFKGNWDAALKKSKKENKLIFLDAYAAWCGPCKVMARKTFTQKEVGDFFNANFINVKMDMEKDENGSRLARKYKLTAYPTLYFVDSGENIIHQALGMQNAKQLIAIGKTALSNNE